MLTVSKAGGKAGSKPMSEGGECARHDAASTRPQQVAECAMGRRAAGRKANVALGLPPDRQAENVITRLTEKADSAHRTRHSGIRRSGA